jgi:phosphoribosylformylglycinamidine synthase
VQPKDDYGDDLKKILGAWNVASKEWVIRQYDHEVQGRMVLKPLQGVDQQGPGDACVVAPVYGSRRAIAISNGMNPKYGDIDPYHMAACAIDEALRNVIAVGGNLERTALLDNFSWGNPDDPTVLGALVRACLGCRDIAKGYGVPFISGKDSLYNEFTVEGQRIIIPHTLLISAICVMPDAAKAISMDFKSPGNTIYIVGLTKEELGGSHYYALMGVQRKEHRTGLAAAAAPPSHTGFIGNSVPRVDVDMGRRIMNNLSRATELGLVKACHDCSEGGLAVALAEMAFAGNVGAEVSLAHVPVQPAGLRDDFILFSESASRFIVEVSSENAKAFEDAMQGCPVAPLGKTNDSGYLIIRGSRDIPLIRETLEELKQAWQQPLSILH